MFTVALHLDQQDHKGKIILSSENIYFKRSKLNQGSRGDSEGYNYRHFSLKYSWWGGGHMKHRVGKEQW